MLTELAPEDLRALGERYITDTRASRRHKPFFTDKMPNKFRHIGLIHLMLPKAKIIDVRREPMASCFSKLKELFGRGQEFTYSIGDISRYSDLSRADATLGRGTSRADTASLVRGRRGRSRGKPGAHPRLLRSWIRTGLRRGLQDRTCCPDCKLRAGSPADFPRRAFPVEELRALARPAQGQFGRALIRYHEEAESLSGVLRLSGCGPVAIKSGR